MPAARADPDAQCGGTSRAAQDVSFDPGRNYSLTWQSGFAGIGYNKKKVGRELKSLSDLWADDLKGRVTVLSSSATPPPWSCSRRGRHLRPFDKAAVQKAFDEVSKRVAGRQTSGGSWEPYLRGPQVRQCHRRNRLERRPLHPAHRDRDPNWEFVIRRPGHALERQPHDPITSVHPSQRRGP